MKRYVAVILSAVMMLALAACSSNRSVGEPDKIDTQNQTSSPEKADAQLQENSVESIEDDDLYTLALADVDQTTTALRNEYNALTTEIASYEKYVENAEKVKDFYSKIEVETENLCIKLRERGADYVDSVIASDMSSDDMYDAMDEVYDSLYDEAGDDIYDELYDDLMDDLYDAFYNGVLENSPDTSDYDEWMDILSSEYEMWSDTGSEVYEYISDYKSDIYELQSDVKSRLWDDDIEKAQREVDRFREDIQGIKDRNISDGGETASMPQESSSAIEPPAATKAPDTAAAETSSEDTSSDMIDGMHSDFKNAMDKYEDFMNEYCDFMEKYNESDGTDSSLLLDYASYMSEYAEMLSAFEKWNSEDLNTKEASYYLEVQTRVSQKLLEVAQ